MKDNNAAYTKQLNSRSWNSISFTPLVGCLLALSLSLPSNLVSLFFFIPFSSCYLFGCLVFVPISIKVSHFPLLQINMRSILQNYFTYYMRRFMKRFFISIFWFYRVCNFINERNRFYCLQTRNFMFNG